MQKFSKKLFLSFKSCILFHVLFSSSTLEYNSWRTKAFEINVSQEEESKKKWSKQGKKAKEVSRVKSWFREEKPNATLGTIGGKSNRVERDSSFTNLLQGEINNICESRLVQSNPQQRILKNNYKKAFHMFTVFHQKSFSLKKRKKSLTWLNNCFIRACWTKESHTNSASEYERSEKKIMMAGCIVRRLWNISLVFKIQCVIKIAKKRGVEDLLLECCILKKLFDEPFDCRQKFFAYAYRYNSAEKVWLWIVFLGYPKASTPWKRSTKIMFSG